MNKVYKRSGSIYICILSGYCVLLVFLINLFRDAVASGGIAYISFTMLISLLFIYALFKSWRNLILKIVITDEGITINKPLKSIDVKWDEISEFGKHRRGIPGNWYFYLRKNKTPFVDIEIGNLEFMGKNEIIAAIFDQAHYARFISLENTSWIPFVKRFEALQWNRKEML